MGRRHQTRALKGHDLHTYFDAFYRDRSSVVHDDASPLGDTESVGLVFVLGAFVLHVAKLELGVSEVRERKQVGVLVEIDVWVDVREQFIGHVDGLLEVGRISTQVEPPGSRPGDFSPLQTLLFYE